MSDQVLQFKYSCIETRETQEDSPSYPGLRTVYRKHFIEAIIQKSRILHSDKSFTSVADDTGITKTFEWKTPRECQERKLIMDGETESKIFSSLVDTKIVHHESDVRKKLEQYDTDVSKFGQDEARTLKEFAAEMTQGESFLLEENGRLLRAVDIVLLKIMGKA